MFGLVLFRVTAGLLRPTIPEDTLRNSSLSGAAGHVSLVILSA